MDSIIGRLRSKTQSDKQTVKMQKHSHVLMVAHHGVSGILPENTIPAFKLAGKHSYFGIETDLHETADGKFVIIHDDNTARVSDKKINVENADLKTIRSIRLKGKNQLDKPLKIPTLEEYLAVCRRYKKVAIIGIKSELTKEKINQLVSIIKSKRYLSQVIFLSDSINNLIILRDLLPLQPLMYLSDNFTDEIFENLKKYRFDLNIKYNTLEKETVMKLHSVGLTVNCRTVNDIEIAEKMIELGADYITTDILE